MSKINIVLSNAEQDMGALTGIARYEQEFCSEFKNKKDINIINISCLKRPTFFIRWFLFFLSIFSINLKNKKKEIYHFASQQLAYSLAFIFKPYYTIITVFDLFQIFPETKNEYSLWEKIKYSVVKSKIKNADKIFTISEYVKNEIIKKLNIKEKKVEVIYGGVDHKIFFKKEVKKYKLLQKYNIPNDKKIILFVGSEQPRKNFKILLEAFNLLIKELNDSIILVKIGKPQWKNARKVYINLIKSLDLDSKIFFTDFVIEEDLVSFYNIADVLVQPTLKEGGLALPILEAMACGCPVIVSNIPVLRETVGDAGIYINPFCANDIKNKIIFCLSDKENREKKIDQGLKRANMFTWEDSSNKLYNFYKKILEEKK